jgi:hypothetical protein
MRFCFCLFVVLLLPRGTDAMPVTLDVGPAGSTFSFRSMDFADLAGTPFNGQALSLDLNFDGQFLAASAVSLFLSMQQSGDIGTWPGGVVGGGGPPDRYFTVSGYLVDANGVGLGPSTPFPLTGELPAQLWPNTNFTLPDGRSYLPATTSYGDGGDPMFRGTPVPPFDDDYRIEPLLFWGLHLDILFPTGSSSLIGSGLTLANFEHPIHVSPATTPTFIVEVPEPATLLLFGTAILLMPLKNGASAAFARLDRKLKNKTPDTLRR